MHGQLYRAERAAAQLTVLDESELLDGLEVTL